MKHELRIIETSTGRHIATVSESVEAAPLVERAKNRAASLHKDFYFKVIKCNAHMLRNEAVFRVYDVERCKYLPAIKKLDYGNY